MAKRKRKQSTPAKPKPKPKPRKRAAAPKRKRKRSSKRKRASSPRRSAGGGSGFKFEVQRVKLNRQGYDTRGKYWGANTGGQKLYCVRVIDRATDIYTDSHVRAVNGREAKSQVQASMMRAIDQRTPPAPKHPLMQHRTHSTPTEGSFGGVATTSFPGFGSYGRKSNRARKAAASGSFEPINLEGATDSELNAIANDPWAHASYRQLAAIYLNSRAARLRGDIQTAQRLENDADFVYERLPPELRW